MVPESYLSEVEDGLVSASDAWLGHAAGVFADALVDVHRDRDQQIDAT